MAVQRAREPEPEPASRRPLLRLVTPEAEQRGDAVAAPELARAAFNNGLRWGIVVASLGFWLPVATALYIWLS